MYIVKHKNNAKRKKHQHAFLTILLTLIIITFLLIISFFGYIVYQAPDFDPKALYTKQASIINDRNGTEIARLGTENRELITYEELPQVLIDAIVATEDSRFFQHNGFDLMRFIKASFGQLKGNQSSGGASTISMQISKNAFTSNESSGIKGIIRKFTDIYMAIFKIETVYSKEEILEIYVNMPYFGSSCYGIEMASQIYFNKSVKDISLPEAALLAGLFKAPSDNDPYNNIYNATKRRNEVLNLMYKHGYITEEQLNDCLNISVSTLLAKKENKKNVYQDFIDTVVEEIIKDTGLNPYTTSMIVETTLDTNIQLAINNVMANPNNFKDDKIQAGLAITSVDDGSILGIGSARYRYASRQYNYATMISRQPGSSIKPFMDYGPLFEYTDATPETMILDAPYTYTNGTNIYNAYRDYKGMITIKQALAESRNIPALKVFQQVGTEKISSYVHSFGIDYGDTLYESAAIGAFEGVSPLEMSAAYGAYARGGYYIKPYSYTKITLRDNNEEIIFNHEKVRVCSPTTAKYINDILSYAISNHNILGTLEIGSTEAAGKTGTTTIEKSVIKAKNLSEDAIMDSWACIYTREYSVALWYGYDEITSKYYMRPNDGTLGRRRIIKKLVKQIFTTNSKLLTSS